MKATLEEIKKICLKAQGNWATSPIENSPLNIQNYKFIVGLIDNEFNNISKNVLSHKDLTLDVETLSVIYCNRLVKFPRRQVKLLHFFMSNPNKVHSRDQILLNVWTEDNQDLIDRTVDVHISIMRKKIPLLKESITCFRGIGYKFEYR